MELASLSRGNDDREAERPEAALVGGAQAVPPPPPPVAADGVFAEELQQQQPVPQPPMPPGAAAGPGFVQGQQPGQAVVVIHQGQQTWKHGLFDCCGDAPTCIGATFSCCWPSVVSITAARVGGAFPLGATTFQDSLYRVSALVALRLLASLLANGSKDEAVLSIVTVFSWVSGVLIIVMIMQLRIEMRRRLGLESRQCEDCLVAAFCQCCAIDQMAKEVDAPEPLSWRPPQGVDVRVPAAGAGAGVPREQPPPAAPAEPVQFA